MTFRGYKEMKVTKIGQVLIVMLALSAGLWCTVSVPAQATTTWYGPTPAAGYASFADSPFSTISFQWFYLENFENGFNVPGVTASAGYRIGVGTNYYSDGYYVDSVEGGTGNSTGHSFFSGDAYSGITFTFDKNILGSLPTHAGVVWTDGNNPIIFTAYDKNNNPLGPLTGNHADGYYTNVGTGDYRFYGVSDPEGISAINIRSTGGAGIEVDHLQYGSVPVPPTALLLGSGLVGLGFLRRKWSLKK
jgi:hypothetical protein